MKTVKERRCQAGVALVIVLWLLVLLSVMAFGFSRSMRSGVRIGLHRLEALQATELARAAIHKGLYDLLTMPPGQRYRLLLPGREQRFTLDGAELAYRIEDERGKVDLNRAPAELIGGLLGSLELPPERTASLSDAILDWRDSDDARRLNGAEGADYAAAGRPGLPPDRPFPSVQELQQVLGMDDLLYRRLLPLVTVHGIDGRINPLTAPRQVLLAIPEADPADVDEAVAQRGTASTGDPAPPLASLAGLGRWLARASGPVYTVTGRARLPSGAVAHRRMVIWLGGRGGGRGYRVLDLFPRGSWEPRREGE